jgi:carbamoyltransferase
MTEYVLALNPAGIELYRPNMHNPSAVIFEDGDIKFGVEEERYTRNKHGYNEFPESSIRDCLDHCGIDLSTVDKIVLPWDLSLEKKNFTSDIRRALFASGSMMERVYRVERNLERHITSQTVAVDLVRDRLSEIDDDVPPIKTQPHHACHAASAFYPSGFDDALVVTVDGLGEYDSTVVWSGDRNGLKRIKTYSYPNSLGHFYRVITAFLGYAPETRSEGKIMGLAPYGEYNPQIEEKLMEVIDTGLDYDVTYLTEYGIQQGVDRLEKLFGRQSKDWGEDFTQWEKDLAWMTQRILEKTMVDIVDHYCSKLGFSTVALAGGVALNCKMNKRIIEADIVDDVYIQPVAHDGGITIGACMLEYSPGSIDKQSNVYYGPEYSTENIRSLLETNKIDYKEPDDLEKTVAKRLADGALAGWFQGRTEMGPRALGNRSILADPREIESRDKVNKFVKHREPWRPFAPSLLEEAVDEYLVSGVVDPFMITTSGVHEEKFDEIPAVLHPSDNTTRPQAVLEDQNPRYYKLIESFGELTGTPVLLNTSFNDSGEPIVNTPTEAIRDLYSMGLDLVVLEDFIIEKQ